VFGSVARDEIGPESDLDLLVEFEENGSLFDLIRFKQELEDIFHIKVNVVTEKSINQLLKKEIMDDAFLI